MSKLLKYIKSFIAVLLIFSACAEIDNSVENNFKQVKTETKWKCDESGNKLYKIYDKYYNTDGKVNRIVEYSIGGTTLSVKKIDYLGNIGRETTTFYDTSGKLDSTTINDNYYNLDGKISHKVAYDSKGDTSLLYSYSYDNAGKLLSSNCAKFSLGGQTFIEIKYLYDINGSLQERILCDVTTGKQTKDSLVYKLDNKTIEKISIDSNGGVENIYTYIYNNYALIYKELECSPTGKIINLFIYDYLYY